MEKNNIERLSALVNAMGVSGEEKDVRDCFKSNVNADEWISDRLGSVFALKRSLNEKAKTLMIAASLDELGLMVSEILPNGELAFVALEAISPASILHQEVCVYTRNHEKVCGVVSCPKVKFMENAASQVKMDELTLDMGMSYEEASKIFTIGDLCMVNGDFKLLNDHIAMGKALNNRLMLEVMCEVFEELKDIELDYHLALGGIAQSVIGWRGSKTATYVVQPGAALVLTGFDTAASQPKAERGKGVTVGIYDKQMLPSKRLLHDFMDKVANVQEYIGVYGNDGSFIHKTLKGTPTLSLGIAMSHIGSSRVMADLKDADQLKMELVKYLKQLSSADIDNFGYGVCYD